MTNQSGIDTPVLTDQTRSKIRARARRLRLQRRLTALTATAVVASVAVLVIVVVRNDRRGVRATAGRAVVANSPTTRPNAGGPSGLRAVPRPPCGEGGPIPFVQVGRTSQAVPDSQRWQRNVTSRDTDLYFQSTTVPSDRFSWPHGGVLPMTKDPALRSCDGQLADNPKASSLCATAATFASTSGLVTPGDLAAPRTVRILTDDPTSTELLCFFILNKNGYTMEQLQSGVRPDPHGTNESIVVTLDRKTGAPRDAGDVLLPR